MSIKLLEIKDFVKNKNKNMSIFSKMFVTFYTQYIKVSLILILTKHRYNLSLYFKIFP